MKRKPLLTSIISGLLISSLLSGCGQSNTQQPQPQQKPTNEVKNTEIVNSVCSNDREMNWRSYDLGYVMKLDENNRLMIKDDKYIFEDFTDQVKRIKNNFEGIKPLNIELSDPETDIDKIDKPELNDEDTIRRYIEWLVMYANYQTDFSTVLSTDFFNRSAYFDGDFLIAIKPHIGIRFLSEARNYAKIIGDDDLEQYLDKTVFYYELTKEQTNTFGYSIARRRTAALNYALGNDGKKTY